MILEIMILKSEILSNIIMISDFPILPHNKIFYPVELVGYIHVYMSARLELDQ